MNKYIRALRAVKKEGTEDSVRRTGVPISDLVSRGLVVRRKRTDKKYTIPENAPRWAYKFRLSRKRYGVEERLTNKVIIKLTNKGKNYLKRYLKTKNDSDNEDKVDDVVDNIDNENY